MKNIILFYMITFIAATLYAQTPGSEQLIGTWVSTVEHNRSFDTYRISFFRDGRCTVRITNDWAEQETTGSWSLDGSLLRINAVFRNSRITYQNNIQWNSALTFFNDNNGFNILGRTSTSGTQTRFTFFRQNSFDEGAIRNAYNELYDKIPLRSRLAVVSISAIDPDEGNYYIDELTLQFVNSGRYTVVERQDINSVINELKFQFSGYVDDDTAVSIGRFLGVNIVITGSISGTGPQKRMVIKAIDVQTAEILAMSSVSL